MSTRVKNLRGRHVGRKAQLDEVTVGITRFQGVLARNPYTDKWAPKWCLMTPNSAGRVNIFEDETVKLL